MLRPFSALDTNQLDCVHHILKHKSVGVTTDCGGGKTVIGLTVAKAVIMKTKRPVLIVAGANGVKGAWSQEYKKWEHTHKLIVRPLVGTPKQREAMFSDDVQIYVISYHLMGWLLKVNPYQFACVIADEAHCLKKSSGTWNREIHKLSKHSMVRLPMTATPKTRQEDDYFGMALWLDGGEALGSTLTDFRARYMREIVLPKGTRLWKLRTKNTGQEIRDAIKHLFIEYDIPDEAKIPIKTKRVRFNLSPESTKLYNSFTKTGVLAGHEIRDGRPLDPVEVTNLASQLSCGFIYDDMQLRISVAELKAAVSVLDLLKKKNRRTLKLFDDRVKFADKILRAVKKKHNGCNVLICYHFKHELVQLTELLPDAVPDTSDNFENDWNAGKIKYGLLQYNRSSESGNLQTGGCVMVMYSQTFSWKDFYQIPRRIARRGQPADTVYLYILHINGTVDDLKEQRMNNSTIGHKKFQKMIMRDL